jgi:polyketide cyclase/dehydrase/lipid transport protein
VRVGAEVILPAGPEAAWGTLVQWEEQPAWMVDAASVRVVSADREGVGARIAARTRIFGLPIVTDTLEVVEWDPPRRLVLVRRGFVRGSGTWELEPAPGGSTFRWTEDIRVPVPVLGELALLAYRPILRRLMRRSLENLVARLR